MTAGMGSHQSARMLTPEWLTPPAIVTALGPFDLDPCAPAQWPHANWPHADWCITPPEDGLSAHWSGRVWLNPPYNDQAGRWLAKLAAHGHGTALIFARTETAWWHDHIWPEATAILFLRGRLIFHRPNGQVAGANAGAPSAVIAYGAHDADLLATSGLPGALVTGWSNQPSAPADLFTGMSQ